MNRANRKFLTILVLLPGIVLRAATPAGYMPASADSGLLFELCPEQLPAGVMLSTGDAHGHHHHEDTEAAADHCQLGHLLITVAGGEAVASIDMAPAPEATMVTRRSTYTAGRDVIVTRSRGPPA